MRATGLTGAALTLYQAIVMRTSQPEVQAELLERLPSRYGASSGDVEAVREFLSRDRAIRECAIDRPRLRHEARPTSNG
jgi:hypothetical protein